MNVERHFLAVSAPMLIAEAVEISAIVLCVEGVVAIGHIFLEGLVLAERVGDPEVNVQVSSTAELPITDLKGHRHFVILVKLLVETLAAMGWELDVVAEHNWQEAD